MRLTPRDLDIIRDIARFRYLSTEQLAATHFSSRKRAQKRLKMLIDEQWLDRVARQTASSIGRSEYVYCVGQRAAREVLHVTSKRKPRDGYFVEHHLTVNQFWLSLERQAAGTGFACHILTEHIPAAKGLGKHITGTVAVQGTNRRFTPDGVFTLSNGTKQLLFFLEVDMGTEVLTGRQNTKSIAFKLEMYRSYLMSQGYQRYSKELDYPFRGFRLLMVFPTDTRCASVRTLVNSHFIWLSTMDRIDAHGPLGSVWQVPDDDGMHSIVNQNMVAAKVAVKGATQTAMT